MKKITKKVFAVFTAITILSAVTIPLSAFAKENDQDDRLTEIYYDKMLGLKGDNSLTISDIKIVKDFADNEYTVVEFSPVGFLIYSPENGVFPECSETMVSPYKDFDSNIYYGGVAEFYHKDTDGKFIHTVTGETYTQDVMTASFAEVNQERAQELKQIKSLPVLDYISNGDYAKFQRSKISTRAAASGEVKNPSWFKDMTSCGYWSKDGGVCGYVALNMLIGYMDRFKNNNAMDDKYWTSSSKTNLKGGNDSLTKYLFDNYGEGKTSTTSMHIHKVSKAYFEAKKVSVSHTSKYPPFISNDAICGNIENDRPVIMFGSYNDYTSVPPYSKCDHAVVAYKYADKSLTHCDYTVHYGWDKTASGSHTAHILNGTTGSYYTVF